MEKLCPQCRETGVCWFEQSANKMALAVPRLEDAGAQKDAAIEAHIAIAADRIPAREQLCPNVALVGQT